LDLGFGERAAPMENVADVLSKSERLTLLRLLKKLGKDAAARPPFHQRSCIPTIRLAADLALLQFEKVDPRTDEKRSVGFGLAFNNAHALMIWPL
jgi:hypothetical protein